MVKKTAAAGQRLEEAYYEYVERAFGDAVPLRSGEATFEASPRYYTYPELARPLLRVLPCTRVVMTLREPLRRAESQYWHDICTPGYQNRLKVTNPFIGGSTSIRANECRPYAGTPPGFVSLLQVLKMEIDLWQRCTAAHGQVPVSLSSDADVASKEATKRRIRVLWNCLCTPLLVNRTAFSKRRVYFGYLVPGLYALPLERWLDSTAPPGHATSRGGSIPKWSARLAIGRQLCRAEICVPPRRVSGCAAFVPHAPRRSRATARSTGRRQCLPSRLSAVPSCISRQADGRIPVLTL